MATQHDRPPAGGRHAAAARRPLLLWATGGAALVLIVSVLLAIHLFFAPGPVDVVNTFWRDIGKSDFANATSLLCTSSEQDALSSQIAFELVPGTSFDTAAITVTLRGAQTPTVASVHTTGALRLKFLGNAIPFAQLDEDLPLHRQDDNWCIDADNVLGYHISSA